jgi:hypothetical protein
MAPVSVRAVVPLKLAALFFAIKKASPIRPIYSDTLSLLVNIF